MWHRCLGLGPRRQRLRISDTLVGEVFNLTLTVTATAATTSWCGGVDGASRFLRRQAIFYSIKDLLNEEQCGFVDIDVVFR